MLSLAVAFSPLVPLLLAQFASYALGCAVTEAVEPTCMFLGLDVGGLLYGLFMLGGFGFAISILLGMGIYKFLQRKSTQW